MFFEIVFRYFWLIALIFTVVNGQLMTWRSQKHISQEPELKESYPPIIRGALIWNLFPWTVMGLGATVGGVPHVGWFFVPRHGGPYVIAFHLSVVVVWAVMIWWVFADRGAEKLIKHPAVFRTPSQNPTVVKLFILLSLLGGVVGMTLMWLNFIPLSELPQL